MFKEGLQVEHARFGVGKIVTIDGNGDNKMATIQFDNHGSKKLLLKFAKLQIVKN
jgi:DNA helicase-2/ATP-dependent DNA helicase PcrA